ncbi:cyclin-J-like protein [Neopsephotus bourkii]|uniref:cyclin-J-like protein n=1 Tax=Neopsephotus bourkii TaxID=309878 RepID=UPI002AA51303|nr:cyclin-J-like protein [Neopsephotus bourkii]
MEEEEWWKEELATDIHHALRMKELKLPVYKARSPQIGMRRCLVDILILLSNHCKLCPTARHLAIYLLDLFMDRYDMTAKQLYIISFGCLLLASKFEDRRHKGPKLELLNKLACMCNVDVVLSKQDLFTIEGLLLENFGWNLCMPTPAHYIDYYLYVSFGANDLHYGWPITSPNKVRELLETYAYYFLDLSVQDPTFLHFRPSLIAAASVCASRICLQVSPIWTMQLEWLTCYSLEHLAQCIEMMLMYYENDVNETSNVKTQETIQYQEQEAVGNMSCQATTQVLFQQSSYHPLTQHSAAFSQFQWPVQDLCSAYRESLQQAHRPSGPLAGSTDSSLRSYTAPQDSLQPSAQALPIRAPFATQVAFGTESRPCISRVCGSSYFSDFTGKY